MEENLTYEERLHLSGKLSNALSHVEELITTLLKLSKFDAGVVQFQNAPVSVKKLADTVFEGMAVQLELKEQKMYPLREISSGQKKRWKIL